jgi:Na+/melibiose symporter-like transporter/AcrR family transcriptional regulator
MVATERKQPQQARAQQTVHVILEATVQILDREGFEAATTTRIAEVAGVSIGSLYQYFSHRDAILNALQDREFCRTLSLMQRVLAEGNLDEAPRKTVSAVLKGLADLYSQSPGLHRVLTIEGLRVAKAERVHAFDLRVIDLVRHFLSATKAPIVRSNVEAAAFILYRQCARRCSPTCSNALTGSMPSDSSRSSRNSSWATCLAPGCAERPTRPRVPRVRETPLSETARDQSTWARRAMSVPDRRDAGCATTASGSDAISVKFRERRASVAGNEKRLGGWLKASYGVGLSAEGIKNNAFNLFLLFYYQQIVGLDSALCGLALFIALCVDGIVDPAIGVLSDGLRSRLGRRHPFMYASSLPLAVCYFAIFVPPAGAGKVVLFAWLTSFAVLTRVAMACFTIPHQSLVAELTTDPDERTTLQSLRTVFAWLFGILNAFLAYTVFLAKTPEYPLGLLNPKGYSSLATFGAAAMFVATGLSTVATNRAALRAQSSGKVAHRVSFGQLPGALRVALKSASYRASVLAGLFVFVGWGMNDNMTNYMTTFFWRFTSAQIGGIIVAIFFASLVVLATARPLARRFGMRRLGMAAGGLGTFILPLLISLRLANLLPNDPSTLLTTFMCVAFLGYAGTIMAMTVVGAMIADVTDEHELVTGERQEGMLFAALSLITKAASGVGVLFTGIFVRLVGIPATTSTAAIDPTIARNLGIVAALSSAAFGMAIVYSFSGYRLDRTAHENVLLQLKDRALLARERSL